MKKAKILLSVLLALTMILALGATAFAAGTIEVANPGTETYKAYKIFDAAESGGDVTYTLAADSEWKDVLLNTDGSSKYDGLTFVPDNAASPTVYTVQKGNTFKAADFADFLRGFDSTTGAVDDHNLTGKTATALAAANPGDPVQGSVAAGYYLVIANDGASNQERAMLTTVLNGKTVKIQNKNDMPLDKTVDGEKEEGVTVGQNLNYKITTRVPTDVAYDDTYYVYRLSDTMTNGLTFNKPVTVKIYDTDGTTVLETIVLTEVTDPSAILGDDEVRYNAHGFELSLDMLTRGKPSRTDPADPSTETVNPLAGKKIEITYTATVNDAAVSVVSENDAVLTYGNDPDNLTVKDTQTKVYTSRILIDKFENGAPEQKLEGAKFILRDTAADKYYYFNTTTGAVEWVAEADFVDSTDAGVTINVKADYLNVANITIAETTNDGKAEFKGLKDGSYELIEIAAPAGYTLLNDPIPVTVDGSASTATGLSEDQILVALTEIVNVANTPGTNLPSTGGIGTTIFTVVGGLLIAGAIIFVIIRKRGEAEA
ncbi:MAG: SpaH/EbpB family LPXTG-anchored major pilin [Oscillospiraceae bacterium]|nr:SpaH/EbpB family LPXTG-anchored major pilin [Oscillospiraceae bacterium]